VILVDVGVPETTGTEGAGEGGTSGEFVVLKGPTTTLDAEPVPGTALEKFVAVLCIQYLVFGSKNGITAW
jgi:hypothetical protein